MRIIYLMLFFLTSWTLSAQNAGIGTATPTEKLEVAGTIYTNQGGIKFPDETVQTTAAFNAPPPTASLKRGGGFAKFLNAQHDGSLDTLGKTKMSLLYHIEYPMVRPPTGPVQAGPVRIIKQTDKGTPGFYNSLIAATDIDNIELYLTRINAAGNPEIYMTIFLTNSIVASVSTELAKEYYGYYSNVDVIELHPQKMAIKDLDTGNCYCYSLVTLMACTCP